jgi:hypothetical protein
MLRITSQNEGIMRASQLESKMQVSVSYNYIKLWPILSFINAAGVLFDHQNILYSIAGIVG